VLAVSLKNGGILLMKSFDDVSPIQMQTGLVDISMEWSNSRHLLAVAGTRPTALPSEGHFNNVLLFYSEVGTLVYTVGIPYSQVKLNHKSV
jgi:tubby-related protein 4